MISRGESGASERGSSLSTATESQGVAPNGRARSSATFVGLALLSVSLYTVNSEILQVTTSDAGTGGRCSTLLMMTLCHSVPVLALPWFIAYRKREDVDKFFVSLSPDGSFPSFSMRVLALSALLLLPAYLWTKSTSYQSVSTANAISQTSVGFAYIGSLAFLQGATGAGENATAVKTCAVGLAIIGSFIGLLDPLGASSKSMLSAGQSEAGAMVGASLALAASATQATYQVYSKVALFPIRDKLEGIALVWVGIALVHVLLLLPAVLFLWPLAPTWMGGEKVEFPNPQHHTKAFLGVFVSCIIAASVNAINSVIAVRGSPVFLTCAYTLALPLSRVADYIIHGLLWAPFQVVGDALIVASFLLLSGLLDAPKPSSSWRADAADAAEEPLQQLKLLVVADSAPEPKESKGA